MKFLAFCTILCFFLFSCDGRATGRETESSAALLATESGSDGCTVSGINNQLKAGFTKLDTTEKGIQFRKIQDTYYAVMQVQGAMIGTLVNFNKDIKPTVYVSTSCPLNLDSDVLAKSGTEYGIVNTQNRTQITFTKASSYLIYFYMTDTPESFGLTGFLAGTPIQVATDALSGLLGTGSTTSTTSSTTPTFRFACSNPTVGACADYYLSTTGAAAITTCSLGPGTTSTTTKQTTACSQTGIIATCKQTVSSIGSIITLYTSPLTTTTAQALCPTSSGGTFQTGSTIPTP